ncbi:MAG: AEC family transporter [Oscillospiraceae bacterium]|nr:AEC family transporter [Oscillospiraceae bacterium]
MTENVLTILTPVFTLFLMIAAGFASAHFKMISPRGAKQLINLLLFVVNPCLIINAFYNTEYAPDKLTGLLWIGLCTVAAHTLAIVIGMFFFKKSDKKSLYRCAIVYSNCGFMALPLTKAVLGDEGVFYGAIFIVVSQIFLWTHGAVSMSGDIKNISVRKALLNPGLVGSALALVVFVFPVNFPAPVSGALKMLADVNTPLAMLVIGVFIARMKFSTLLKSRNLYIVSLLRLLVVPAVLLPLFYFLPISPLIFMASLIPACAPAAANVVLFSARFGKDEVEASRIVTFTTVLSVFTMPVFIAIGQMLA